MERYYTFQWTQGGITIFEPALTLWVLHTMAPSSPARIAAIELITFRFLIRVSCKWQDFLCTFMSLEKHPQFKNELAELT